MSDYNDFGFENADESHSHAYLLEPLIHLLGSSEGKTILDLGCGNGSLTRSLISNGYNVYGTDASAKGIKLAQELHPDRFALQNAEAHRAQRLRRRIGEVMERRREPIRSALQRLPLFVRG